MTAQISTYLTELRNALIAEKLWSSQIPSASALLSSQPFAIDTLDIEQWLQFIFIPKMEALILADLPLPTRLHLSPVVQMSFTNRKITAPKTLALVSLIDGDFIEEPVNA